MGTRASFWIGDPRDLETRKWLGCIHADGFVETQVRKGLPTGECGAERFESWVISAHSRCRIFTSPEEGVWPYSWDHDIFLTDRTYFWKDDRIYVVCFHSITRTVPELIAHNKDYSEWDEDDNSTWEEEPNSPDDPTTSNIPAPFPSREP